MPKLLAIAPYPYRSADTRYRISQFIPYLEKAGWAVTVRSFMDDAFFQMYHTRGHLLEKVIRTLHSTWRRVTDVLAAAKYDAALLHKEAFPFGPPLMEAALHQRVPRLIYDMDDAYWTHPPQFRQIGRCLRDPQRIPKILRMVDHVLAGNEFLADFARAYNPSTTVLPTVLDTRHYCARAERQDGVVTIGWVGRWSSAPYLAALEAVLSRVAKAHGNVRLRLIGAGSVTLTGVPVETVPWRLEEEIESIAQFDIGIMPLPDDMYSQGKCGFKLLQYMALGIPGVASPVGVNRTIVQDGVNGFLADSEDEWFNKLSALVADYELRRRIGQAGRQSVEAHFSVDRAVPQLLRILASS